MGHIACDHPRYRTEQNPKTQVKTVRCQRCSEIILSMTFDEMEADPNNPVLQALLKKIRNQHRGEES
jgi:hypothetical protein